jgi:polysaccharide export outer membrane protein
MTRIWRIVAAAGMTAALGATAAGASAASRDATNASLPPPRAADMSQGLDAYRIGPMDKLDVNVFQVKDLTGVVDVDAAGNISLPLIGSVQASGRTTREVSREIADRLKAGYIKDPQVTVMVKEAVSQKVTVEGAVEKPGVYPIVGHTTLSTAVALAAGADPARANERRVRLIRTVDGKKLQASYNLVDIRKGTAPDPDIYGNDIIVVENSTSRGILRDIATASPLFYLMSVW